MLVMQKYRELRPRLDLVGGRLLEQVMLDVRRQKGSRYAPTASPNAWDRNRLISLED